MQTPRLLFRCPVSGAGAADAAGSNIAFCCCLAEESGSIASQAEPLFAMNEDQIRRRVFLRLLGHPAVIAPLLLGLTACTAAWALDWPSALAWFAMSAGAVSAFGAYLTRLIFDNGKTAQAVVTEMQQRDQRTLQATLDELDRRLVSSDNDPRPEAALRDLRALVFAFDDFAEKTDSLHAPAVLDVRSRVRQIFDSSVHSLEQTLQLGDTAKILQLPEARQPLLEQREKIITDIQAGIRQLGGTLAALQRLGAGAQSTRELARLREELDLSLQIAGRVEERLNSLLDQTESGIRSQPPRLRAASNQKGN